MIVIGCDPGTEQSAVVVWDGGSVLLYGINSNAGVLLDLDDESYPVDSVLVIEQIESFGMAVGKETFETVFWTGRFAQAWMPRRWDRVPHRIIKQHLCHTARATDANIRQALIDRFGPSTEKAIGSKKVPGPLFGIKSHCWAALAVAVTYFDLHGHETNLIRPGVQGEF